MKALGREGPPPRGDRRARRLRRALRRLRAHALQAAAAGDLHRRRRHQGRDRPGDGRARHDRLRPGRHGRRRPRRVRRRAALHDRLHRHRPGRPRADRRDRQGHRRGAASRPAARSSAARPPSTRVCWAPTSTTSPAPPPASSRPTSCSAPAGCAPATWSSRWPPSGLHSNGYSLVRHVLLEHRRSGRSTATCPSSAAPSARSCSSRPASMPRPASRWPTAPAVHAMSHVTGGGLAANLARVLPEELRATIDRGTWTPQPIFDLVRQVGDVSPARPRGDPQLRGRHGRAQRPGRRRRRASRCWPSAASTAWVAGEVDVDPDQAARRPVAAWWCQHRRVGLRLVVESHACPSDFGTEGRSGVPEQTRSR